MTDYYVAKYGNNSNTGTQAYPFLTIQKAIDIITPGDTIFIKQGVYNEKLKVGWKNTEESPVWIKIQNYQNDIVTVDGTGLYVYGSAPTDYWEGLLFILFSNYIEVTGLNLINSSWIGLFCYHNSNIKINKCYCYNTYASGILAEASSKVFIDKNELNLVCNAPITFTTGTQECISIGYSDTFEVSNNYIHHGGKPKYGGEGIDCKFGSSNGKVFANEIHDVQHGGLYADAWSTYVTNIEFYNNIVHDIIDGSGLGVGAEESGTVDNINFHNNLVYNATIAGIMINAYKNPNNPIIPNLNNITIQNNTVNNSLRGLWLGPWNSHISNCIIRNNIFSNNALCTILKSNASTYSNLQIDNNLLYEFKGFIGNPNDPLPGYENIEVKGTNSIEANPLFINLANNDFRLQPDSPAVGYGAYPYPLKCEFIYSQ